MPAGTADGEGLCAHLECGVVVAGSWKLLIESECWWALGGVVVERVEV